MRWLERLCARRRLTRRTGPHVDGGVCRGISSSSVERIWHAAALKPPRIDTFKISNDPEFKEKVTNVVGLYMNLPVEAMVTHTYRRHDTTTLFTAPDIKCGIVIGKCSRAIAPGSSFDSRIRSIASRTSTSICT